MGSEMCIRDSSKSLQWIITDLICGAYYNAIQMARLLLESIIQAYWLTLMFKSFDDQIKHARRMDEDGSSFRTDMIWYLDLKKSEKEFIINLYRSLSAKSHVSAETMDKIIQKEDRAFIYVYDEETLNNCINLIENVLDVMFSLTVDVFPKIRRKVKKTIREIEAKGKKLNLPLTFKRTS